MTIKHIFLHSIFHYSYATNIIVIMLRWKKVYYLKCILFKHHVCCIDHNLCKQTNKQINKLVTITLKLEYYDNQDENFS